MEKAELKNTLEALLFITDTPLSVQKLKELSGKNTDAVKEALKELRDEYDNRLSAVFIKEVAGGLQMATRAEYGEWVKKLYQDKITYRLSRSAMETLAIIAYKQPITRSEIEEIRGVDASGVIENLLEKKLVKICGRKEIAGRPMLYATTSEFLKYFGLKNLAEIPSLEELVPPERLLNENASQSEMPFDEQDGQTGGSVVEPAEKAVESDETVSSENEIEPIKTSSKES